MTAIAYCILAHKEPERIARLINRIKTPTDFIYVHFNKIIGKEQFNSWKQLIEQKCPSTNLKITSNVLCKWGSFGNVESTLNAMQHYKDFNYDYFVNLSGECYPIKPVNVIKNTFAGQTTAFMEFFELPSPFWGNGGMNRIQNRHYFVLHNGRLKILRIPRFSKKLPFNLKPFGGSQWFCLPKQLVSYILQFVDQNKSFKNFYERSLIPDEMFFQTVLINSPFRSQICNNNLRYINWVGSKEGHPKYLTKSDFDKIVCCDKLFARKFSLSVDKDILDLIDQKLTN